MKLLIATRNRHKLAEIQAILRIPGLELLDLNDGDGIPEVEEDGTTFVENAVKKAVTVARSAGLWALADDSGLEVDALQGAPGVYSARYAGEPVDYQANNLKLLRELSQAQTRRARFRSVLALSDPAGNQIRTVEGICEGHITHAARGACGFGYDPLFVPDGHAQTFAEMDAAGKNRISHRAAALARAAAEWKDLLVSLICASDSN